MSRNLINVLKGLFTCRWQSALTLLILSFALLGCGDDAKLKPLQHGDVILAFGDSLTVGVGVEAEYSYPKVLASLTGHRVISAGVSGETTSEGLLRLPALIEEHSPSLLILLEGGNDILRNQNLDQTKDNLGEMIELAQHADAQVVLLGVPEKRLFSDSAPFYRELAQKYDVVFDESLIAGLMRSPDKKSDMIHFNEAGYRALAKGVYDVLSEQGAL